MELRDKVLIVEDDKGIQNFMSTVISSNGYDVLAADTSAKARTMVSSHCPDLVILDLGLPDGDGLEVLRYIREWTHLPVVVVSARSHERDKVEALDSGADDYITKPFGTSELLARIRTALRHTRTASSNSSAAHTGRFVTGGLEIDFEKRRVTVRGEEVHLTQNEYRIVSMLALSAGRVITYDSLLKELWGPCSRQNNQILRVNMANIRHKLELNPAEPEFIFTEVGVGYRMAEGA